MDGVLLVWTVLLLSRPLERMRPSALRVTLWGYLSLGLVYGRGRVRRRRGWEWSVRRSWSS